jgi:hypothetical protein
MSAPASLSRPIPEADLPRVRDFINWCMAHGTPPGVELKRLDPYDLDAPKDAPPTRPGVRHFFLHVGLAPEANTGDDWMHVVSVADDVAADAIALKHTELLAHIARIEQPLGDVEICGFEMRDIPMAREEQRENGADLIDASRAANAACDAIRDAVADPRSWAPIGKSAVMVGHYICIRVFPDGRRALLVPAEAAA